MLSPIAFSSIVCGIAIVGEGLLMGKAGGQFMKALKQPSFAPPVWAWAFIGIAYYGICFVVLMRVTRVASGNSTASVLLILLMAANTFWNFIYFRLRRLRVVFWYSVVYSVLAVIVLVSVIEVDRRAASLFGIYIAYLPYALIIFYRTWKLNSQFE